MTTVVGIDPGITTGISVVRISGEQAIVLASASILARDLLVGLVDDDLRKLLEQGEAIVIEDTPTPTLGKMNRDLASVIRYLIGSVSQSGVEAVYYVAPGAWKPKMGKTRRSVLFGDWHPDTRHEEDAARLALFTAKYVMREQ